MRLSKHGVGYVQGSLGGGKSLLCVKIMQQALLDGRRVVTNIDLNLEKLLPAKLKNVDCTRIPDKPDIDDLEAIGYGYDITGPNDYDESKFGIIVLDELGTWFNSREWNDKGRRKIINWLLHSRKRRWSLLLIIQDIELLDNQAKAATAKQYLYMCSNMGSYAIPILSPLCKVITGKPLTLPHLHKASVWIGTGPNRIKHDTHIYKSKDLYPAYNTSQEFIERDNQESKMMCSMLSPWHLKGRYLPPPKDLNYYRKKITDHVEYLVLASLASMLLSLSSLVYAMVSPAKQIVERVIIEKAPEKPTPSPTTHTKQKNEVIPVHDCSPVENQYQTAFINGSVQSPEGWIYLLNHEGYEISSKELALEHGVITQGKGRCKVKLIIESCPITLTCSRPTRPPITAAGGDRGPGADGSALTNTIKTFL